MLLTQIGVTKCSIWKQFVLQGEQAEELVTRVKAKEKENKLRQEKSTQCTPEKSFQSNRKNIWQQRLHLLPSINQLEGGNASGQTHANK